MRLLVVTQYFWPENFRINDMVAEMVRRGHQVTVLTGYPNYPAGRFFPEFVRHPENFNMFEGAEIVRVPHTARGAGGARLALNYLTHALSACVAGLWKLRGRQFDVIFCYGASPVTIGLPAAVMKTAKRAPMAFWVLDLWPESLKAVGVVKSERILSLVGRLVAFIYKRFDLILAQSHSFIPQIRQYAGAEARVEYFPSWAEAVFDLEGVEPAPELELVPDKFTVLFAGNVGDAQDFPAILDAAELLKDDPRIRWAIVGDGRMSPWLEVEVASRGLEHCFELLGRYPVERMPSFFKHADALLVSLKDELIFSMTIPGKVQSYLAAGIPVLAMLNGEGAEVINKAGAGLTCNAGDAPGLATAVRRLASMSASELELMGQNGAKASAAQFERGALMTQLEHALSTLGDACGAMSAPKSVDVR